MNEDELAGVLLEPLRAEPPVRSFVDVPRALRDGRRRAQRRVWRAFSAAAAAVTAAAVAGGTFAVAGRHPDPQPTPRPRPTLALPHDPALPTSCTAAVLPLGGESRAYVSAGDPTGRWLVGTVDIIARDKFLIWHDGELVATIPISPSGGMGFIDINASGVAVGTEFGRPVAVRDGKKTVMKGDGSPFKINEDGSVIGASPTGRLVRWPAVDAEPEPFRPGGDTVPLGSFMMGDDGLFVISSQDDKAFVLWYPDGRSRTVTIPAKDRLRPHAYRNGWLYFEKTDPVLRYAPATGEWQTIAARPQSPALPQVVIGRSWFGLPAPTGEPEQRFDIDSLIAESDDGRHFAGTLSPAGVPVEWTCR